MKEVILEIVRTPVKLYLITWVYFLVWREKRIPGWLQEEFKEEFKEYTPLGKPEKYRM